MASAVIHIAVANEVNKVLKKDKSKFLIGSVAPDISRLIDEDRNISHFLRPGEKVPRIDEFLAKYKNHLNDDFVLGYYVHLYTDYLWFKYFLTEIMNENKITKLDGTVVNLNGNMDRLYIYNDYTNLNIQLIDEYNLDLKILYNEIPEINNIIDEIPIDRIKILTDNIGRIIEKTKENKTFLFDISNIIKFIDTSTKLILANLNELNVI